MDEYLIPTQFGEAEFVEKKSRFIGRVWPVDTEEEALARIQEMKKKHYDATHNCWAYIIRDGAVRFSDDGEPGGTAGMPMLQVLQREGLFNVVCVVTRYFGGILLGAGGLVRAYTKGAKIAVDAAGKSMKAMIAFGIQLSIDANCNGVVVFEAKTDELEQHYIRDFGARPVASLYPDGPKTFMIADQAAKDIFSSYLF